MTDKTRVWAVKSTIRPDIVCWPAIILSPVMLLNSGENSFHQKPQIHKIIWKVVQVIRRTSFSVNCSRQFYIVLCSLKKKEKYLGMVVWTVFFRTNSVFQPEISAWGPKWPLQPIFWGSDISRKGQCTSIFLICKREETVGKLRKWKWQFIWSWHGASLFIHNRGNLR